MSNSTPLPSSEAAPAHELSDAWLTERIGHVEERHARYAKYDAEERAANRLDPGCDEDQGTDWEDPVANELAELRLLRAIRDARAQLQTALSERDEDHKKQEAAGVIISLMEINTSSLKAQLATARSEVEQLRTENTKLWNCLSLTRDDVFVGWADPELIDPALERIDRMLSQMAAPSSSAGVT